MKLNTLLLIAQSIAIGSAGLINKRDGTCEVNPNERNDCGYYGINQNQCESKGCCWSPTDVQNAPWCFFKKEIDHHDEYDDKTCEFDIYQRTDCGYYGIGENECKNKGCCWSPSSVNNIPWCFYSQQLVDEKCKISEFDRVLCGSLDISKSECISKGCCYNELAPKCYKQGGVTKCVDGNEYVPKCFKPKYTPTTVTSKPSPTTGSKHGYCSNTGYKLCPPKTPEVYEDEKEGCVYGLDENGDWCLVRSIWFPKYETDIKRCYTLTQYGFLGEVCTAMGGILETTNTKGLCGGEYSVCNCPSFTTCIAATPTPVA